MQARFFILRATCQKAKLSPDRTNCQKKRLIVPYPLWAIPPLEKDLADPTYPVTPPGSRATKDLLKQAEENWLKQPEMKFTPMVLHLLLKARRPSIPTTWMMRSAGRKTSWIMILPDEAIIKNHFKTFPHQKIHKHFKSTNQTRQVNYTKHKTTKENYENTSICRFNACFCSSIFAGFPVWC